MILQELLNNKINRKNKVIPLLQALLIPSKRTRKTSQAVKAKESRYQAIIPLSEQTGTRTITYIPLDSREKSYVGSAILVMLVNEYVVGISKTHLREDDSSTVFRKSFFSKKPVWATGHIIEKYLFFSYLRLMRRENIWANSLFLVKKPFYVPIREEVNDHGTYKE